MCMCCKLFIALRVNDVGRDSSVGIVTHYGAGRSGDRAPAEGGIFRTRPDKPWSTPSLIYNGYRVFPGGKEARAWS